MEDDVVTPLCYDCHCVLSPRERLRYEDRCEVCEGRWEWRNALWHQGRPDPELALMAQVGAH